MEDIKLKLRRIIGVLLCLALCLGMLSGCGGEKRYSGEFYGAFDTVVIVTAYCVSQEEFDGLFSQAEEELLRLSRLYDIYVPYEGVTGLYQLNQKAGQGPVKVEPEVMDLLLFARECYDRTGGVVNVAMGSVLSIWHDLREQAAEEPEKAQLPSREELSQAAEHCRIEDLVLDEEAGTAELRDSQMSLDVGAVAKGFAVQRVTESLMESGYENFVISAGGNVQAQGAPPEKEGWSVGIEDPQQAGELIDTVTITSQAVVTSGGYERFYTVDGKRYHHIIDPETLYPAQRMLSATVICDDGALADCLSTALFLMEPEEALEFARSQGARAILVTLDGQVLDTQEK